MACAVIASFGELFDRLFADDPFAKPHLFIFEGNRGSSVGKITAAGLTIISSMTCSLFLFASLPDFILGEYKHEKEFIKNR